MSYVGVRDRDASNGAAPATASRGTGSQVCSIFVTCVRRRARARRRGQNVSLSTSWAGCTLKMVLKVPSIAPFWRLGLGLGPWRNVTADTPLSGLYGSSGSCGAGARTALAHVRDARQRPQHAPHAPHRQPARLRFAIGDAPREEQRWYRTHGRALDDESRYELDALARPFAVVAAAEAEVGRRAEQAVRRGARDRVEEMRVVVAPSVARAPLSRLRRRRHSTGRSPGLRPPYPRWRCPMPR